MKQIVKSRYVTLLNRVSLLLQEARHKTVRQINLVITETYWQIGHLIVEEEQRGKQRAEYGQYLIRRFAKDLTNQFGKGFTETNLKYRRQFYLTYPKLHAVRR